MTTRKVIECICIRYSVSKRELADRIKMSPQNFNQKISKGSLQTRDFLAAINSVNLDMRIFKNNNYDVSYDAAMLRKSNVFSDAFFDVLSAFGCEAVFEDKVTREELKLDNIKSKRTSETEKHFANFKAMHKGKFYNTASSKIITNDFDDPDIYGADGIARELYVDKDGEYFFAEYRNDSTKNKVRAVTEKEALEFIEANGGKY